LGLIPIDAIMVGLNIFSSIVMSYGIRTIT